MEFYCFPRKMSTRRWILEPKMSGFGPQMGIACAFKSDLKGKVDESKGTLLPMHGILLFSKENEHPRVAIGPSGTRFWSQFGAPRAPRMHHDTSVSFGKIRFQWVWASNEHCMCIQVGFEG